VGRGFLWNDVSFSIAKNNLLYQRLWDAIVVVGLGYKGPTYDELRGAIVQKEKEDIKTKLEDYK
jgi:hypothetical protein